MPPYLRFPETEGIRQRFWGCRPRNPSCGLISLETGTKIFAWANMLYGASFTILCVFGLIFPLLHRPSEVRDILNGKTSKNVNKELDLSSISKVYMSHSVVVLQAVLFISFLIYAALWHVSRKLKNAILERDLPNLKTYYIWILLILLVDLPTFITESEIVWVRAFLFDIPITILEIMGLVFTHAFIATLINPEGGQNDDMNRIQFNP